MATCENHLHTINFAHRTEEGHIRSITAISHGSRIVLRELALSRGQDGINVVRTRLTSPDYNTKNTFPFATQRVTIQRTDGSTYGYTTNSNSPTIDQILAASRLSVVSADRDSPYPTRIIIQKHSSRNPAQCILPSTPHLLYGCSMSTSIANEIPTVSTIVHRRFPHKKNQGLHELLPTWPNERVQLDCRRSIATEAQSPILTSTDRRYRLGSREEDGRTYES